MKKILLVDDSETLRAEVKDLLGKSYEVLEAVNGVDGLEKIKSNNDLSLILCDVNMPEMDGVTMCRKLHESAEIKSPPIFMLTTEATPEMKAQCKEYGVMAWVTKPYNPEKLLAVVNKVVNK